MEYGYGLFFAGIAGVCWGLAPVLQKRALGEMRLFELNAARGLGLLTTLFPLLCFWDVGLLRLDAEACLLLFLMALLNNIVGDLFLFMAIRDIGVSLASPITSSYPLLVALISWAGFGENMTSHVLIGTFSVVTGLVLLNVRKGPSRPGFRPRGIVFALLAAVCWALGLTLNKVLILRGTDPAAITFWRGSFFGVMSLVCLGASIALRPETAGRLKTFSRSAWLAGGGAGILALLIGGWVYASSVVLIPISVATPVASCSPLVAALLACLLMGETLRPVQWLGIVCVVSGAIFVGL